MTDMVTFARVRVVRREEVLVVRVTRRRARTVLKAKEVAAAEVIDFVSTGGPIFCTFYFTFSVITRSSLGVNAMFFLELELSFSEMACR